MRLVSVTVDLTEVPKNLALRATRPDLLFAFCGVHPSNASRSGVVEDSLRRFAEESDGLGEIGLDTRYSEVSRDSAQMTTFVQQLEIAEKLGKPVEVHSRGSERTCLDLLGTYTLKRVLMHWFEGEEQLDEVVSRGYFVSFGPALLYSSKLGRIVRKMDSNLILTESDAPVAFRALDGIGGPHTIPSVLFRILELRGGNNFDELAVTVSTNLDRFVAKQGN